MGGSVGSDRVGSDITNIRSALTGSDINDIRSSDRI